MSVKMCLQFFKLYFILSFLVLIRGENNEKTCGVVTKPKGNRVVGGEIIGYMKYEWFAILMHNKQLSCGGSLIDKQHVITAAHCYKPFFQKEKAGEMTFEEIYLVQLGTDNSCLREATTQIYETSKVYIHEKYYDDLLYYDIALLVLNKPTYDYVPVCLPPFRYESNNRTYLQGTVVGLGKESSTAWRLPCQVKEAKVEVQADTVCRHFLNNRKTDGSKMHDAFCAGSGNGDIDTCQGDSGGPLLVEMGDNRMMILGITSYGFGCAEKDTYGVYTDVSHFLNWIHNKMQTGKHLEAAAKESKPISTPIKQKAPTRRQRKPSNILQQILNNW